MSCDKPSLVRPCNPRHSRPHITIPIRAKAWAPVPSGARAWRERSCRAKGSRGSGSHQVLPLPLPTIREQGVGPSASPRPHAALVPRHDSCAILALARAPHSPAVTRPHAAGAGSDFAARRGEDQNWPDPNRARRASRRDSAWRGTAAARPSSPDGSPWVRGPRPRLWVHTLLVSGCLWAVAWGGGRPSRLGAAPWPTSHMPFPPPAYSSSGPLSSSPPSSPPPPPRPSRPPPPPPSSSSPVPPPEPSW
jgi:hypothetical protein